MTPAAPLYSNQRLLDFDWADVTAAWLQKFPDPALKQVSSVETVGRVVCEADRTMRLRRLFLCSFSIPRVVERILGKKAQVVCVEEAHWDLAMRRLTVHGRNETLRNVISIHEVCCFTEVSPGQTLYTQSATVRYRSGALSGWLLPAANELLAGVCQRHAHEGMAAMAERCARAASAGNAEGAEGAEGAVRLGADAGARAGAGYFGGLAWNYGLPLLAATAVGLWCAPGLARRRPEAEEQ